MTMASIWRDQVHGFRTLRKSPGFTLTVVVILAVGIGANTAVFSVVDAAFLRRLPYPAPDRLLMLPATHRPDERGTEVSAAKFLDWRRESRSFAQLGAFGPASLNLSGAGSPERLQAAQITPGALAALGVQPMLGRLFRPDEERADSRLAILSYGLWRSRFGADPRVLGRVVRLGGVSYPVIGVMPPRFRFPRDDVQIWIPLRLTRERAADRQSRWLYVVGRLRDGVSPRAAQAEMSALNGALASQHPEVDKDWSARLVPLREQLVGSLRPALTILLATVLMVLVIACANVASLQLARAAGRRSEMAIRAALGASRQAILRQLLLEGSTLAALGGALGIVLARFSLRLLVAAVPSPFPGFVDASLDGRVLVFTVAIALLTGVAFGLAPALAASRSDLVGELRGGSRGGASSGGRRQLRARRLLTIAEVAGALTLLVGAGLLLSSFDHLRRVAPGFDPDGVLTMELVLPPARYPTDARITAFFRQLVERTAGEAGVTAAGGITDLPLGGSNQTESYAVAGPQPIDLDRLPEAGYRGVMPGTFRALGIPILAGRDLSPRDTPRSPPVLLVNRTFAARNWPGHDAIGAIGKFVLVGGRTPHEVIGIVGDVRHDRLDAAPVPEIYVSYGQHSFNSMVLVARSSAGAAGLADRLRAQVRALDPEQAVFNVKSLRAVVAESTVAPQIYATLLGAFAGVALFLSILGIYALVSYTVAQRRHEMGVRAALGARLGDLLALVIGEGMTLAAAGVAAGLVLARGAAQAMTGLLFGVQPGDPRIFGATALVLAAAALAASLAPAIRAARVDPTEALRMR
jgi:putative ABC transport system permease protein